MQSSVDLLREGTKMATVGHIVAAIGFGAFIIIGMYCTHQLWDGLSWCAGKVRDKLRAVVENPPPLPYWRRPDA